MTEIFNRNFSSPYASLSQKIRPCTVIDFTVEFPFFQGGKKYIQKQTWCCRNMVNIDKWHERLKRRNNEENFAFFQLNCLPFIKRNFFFIFCVSFCWQRKTKKPCRYGRTLQTEAYFFYINRIRGVSRNFFRLEGFWFFRISFHLKLIFFDIFENRDHIGFQSLKRGSLFWKLIYSGT